MIAHAGSSYNGGVRLKTYHPCRSDLALLIDNNDQHATTPILDSEFSSQRIHMIIELDGNPSAARRYWLRLRKRWLERGVPRISEVRRG